jgi:membrane protease YdiL (CAAX protease family)
MAGSSASSNLNPTAVILGVVFLLILAIIAAVLFLSFSQNGYYLGMLYTGILALVFTLGLYLCSALVRGNFLRLTSTGTFWFGIVLLLGADLATPDSAFPGSTSSTDDFGPGFARVPLLVITLIIMAIGLGVSIWQSNARKVEQVREDKRAEWRRQTGVVAPGEEGQAPRTQQNNQR